MLFLTVRRAYLAAVIVGQLLASSSCVSIDGDDGRATADSSNRKPISLFDYENYKKIFNKQYRTSLEDSTRRCYFYARAMAVFVSGVNYKYRMRDHYNAMNEMSDWSPEEREKIKNKRVPHTNAPGETTESIESLAFLPAEGERPEQTLLKFLESKKHEDRRYEDLLNELLRTQFDSGGSSQSSSRLRRSKREAHSTRPPRNFSFANLINHDAEPEPVTRRTHVESNNPNYEFIETENRGLRDQIEDVELILVDSREANEREMGSLDSQLESQLGSLSIKESSSDRSGSAGDLRDEMFFDYRNSPCLSKIRTQGRCGSCYAFAAMAIFEWVYCKRKGSLVGFSEQYMIDCGRRHIEGIYGCEGGTVDGVYNFVHNFGLELKSRYPYVERNATCPYDDGADLETTGYIRIDLAAVIEVPIDDWPKALELEPLYIMIQMVEDFFEYGGGVYDGAQCLVDHDEVEEVHSVVLVGHGREDGEEFWLIRNSHGRNWGEHGYWKLAKSAPHCIFDGSAYALNWNTDLNKLRPHTNRRNNRKIVPRRKKKRGKIPVRN